VPPRLEDEDDRVLDDAVCVLNERGIKTKARKKEDSVDI
jgi:hypothetical protein